MGTRARSGTPKRLLVVDDQPFVAELVGRALAAGRFVIESAASAPEAEARLGVAPLPDLVILEPYVLGGLALLRGLKQRWPALPVLVVTASVEAAAEADTLAAGADVFRRKPFELAELSRTIQSLVAKRSRARRRPFRLLLADRDVQAMLAREGVVLDPSRCTIMKAANGDEVIRLAERRRPDLVILDGDEFGPGLSPTLARLKEDPAPRGRSVCVTIAPGPDREESLLALGADAVLARPVGRQRFYELLKAIGVGTALEIRVPADAEVPYVVGSEGRRGRLANLSSGGCCLAARPASAAGARLRIQLALPGFTEAAWVGGTVRWVHEPTHAKGPQPEPSMGVQFEEVPRVAANTIRLYVMLARDVLRVS